MCIENYFFIGPRIILDVIRGIANLFFGLQCIAGLAVEGNWFECCTLFPTKNTTLSPDLVTRGLALLDLEVRQIWWTKCIEWNLVLFHGKISFLGVLRLFYLISHIQLRIIAWLAKPWTPEICQECYFSQITRPKSTRQTTECYM